MEYMITERHGYIVFGVLDDLPRGHQRLYLKKILAYDVVSQDTASE
jgi:hypothetical protein